MPSPFPGMNPYLEGPSLWDTVHFSLIVAMQNKLAVALRPHYFVALKHTLYLHELSAEARRITTSPVEEFRVRSLEVMDIQNNRAITVIEIQNPSTKIPGADRDQYAAKRDRILQSGANLVEIDLLRVGRTIEGDGFPKCDYSVLVVRSDQLPTAVFWPIKLRERLPIISIPLVNGDVETQIDLQALLHEVYDSAGFDLVAYRDDPEPSLAPADMDWAKEILKKSDGSHFAG